jgi:hypothetical protein
MSPVVVSVVTAVLVVFMLWFAFGTQHNIRRGNSFLRWLQGGLPLIGRRASLRWMGSTAVQLDIKEPEEPFSHAEIVIVLEPRDLGWLWAWSRRRGRRDFLILRGRLRRAPRLELEAGGPRGWTGQDRVGKLDWDAWEKGDWGDADLQVAHSRDADTDAVHRIWKELSEVSGGVWRLSVRRDEPHLEVHLLPPDTEEVGAEKILRTFRELGRSVMRKT